ncbi:MAG: archease [Anaerolineae bacterium]|nr:archease [Anaerolineae bacterium]
MPYEYLDHTADLAIRATGRTPEEALSEGARAMLAAMADLESIRRLVQIDQRCTAPDIPALFVEWLNELLYQRETRDLVLATARVVRLTSHQDGWTLEGVAEGEPLDRARHELYTEIKGATYAGLQFQCAPDHCVIRCVLDV